MNSLITAGLLFHFFRIFPQKIKLSLFQRSLVYLGAFLPIGDLFIYLILQKRLYQTDGLYFHSFFYQSIFWAGVAWIIWILWRDVKSSLSFLLPLLGLAGYTGISLLSSGSTYYFYPFSTKLINLDLMKDGYSFLTLSVFFFFVLSYWKYPEKKLINIFVTLLFISYSSFMVGMNFFIHQQLPKEFSNVSQINVMAKSQFLGKWQVIARKKEKYIVWEYSLFEKNKKIKEYNYSNDSELVNSLKENPFIRKIIRDSIRNPVFNIQVQSEGLYLTISEVVERNELFWLEKIVLQLNNSGKIINIKTKYQTLSKTSI
ncbi:MAG: hypothetical protein ACI86H_000235 [bacterium]|jgi:hypothetical protein